MNRAKILLFALGDQSKVAMVIERVLAMAKYAKVTLAEARAIALKASPGKITDDQASEPNLFAGDWTEHGRWSFEAIDSKLSELSVTMTGTFPKGVFQ